jgi:hypothetical protein
LNVVGAVANEDRAPDDALDALIRTFPNGIVLRKLDWYQPTDHDVCFRPTWSSSHPLAAALQVSFLLRGSDGHEVARADTQPQAGLAPTWSWPIGVAVHDSYCVPTVGTLGPGEAYTLLVRWYRVLDQHATGEVTLVGIREQETVNAPNVPHLVITDHHYVTAQDVSNPEVTFAGSIQLLSHDIVTASDALSLTLRWSSPVTLTQDYKRFVHLAPLSSPEPIRQVDGFTLDGMYPTGMWIPSESVSETIKLDLAGVPPGDYQLAVGWYDPETLTRLPAVGKTEPITDGRYVVAHIHLQH